MQNRRQFVACLALGPLFVAPPNLASAKVPDVYAENGVALRGADVVAYLHNGRFERGSPDQAVMWRGAVWHFGSEANRVAFEMDPYAFAPEFGGYCAYALSIGEISPVDPAAFTVHDGRLYLNFSMEVRQHWRVDMARNIARAGTNWQLIQQS